MHVSAEVPAFPGLQRPREFATSCLESAKGGCFARVCFFLHYVTCVLAYWTELKMKKSGGMLNITSRSIAHAANKDM